MKMTALKNFTEIPVSVAFKHLSVKALYLYAKFKMLSWYTTSKNVSFSERTWMTNPISKKMEIKKRETFESMVKELTQNGLISIRKEVRTNCYEILPATDTESNPRFMMIQNSFINCDLPIAVKGFALMMLMNNTRIEDNYSELERISGISRNSCKKYLDLLKEGGYVSNNCFTDKVFIDAAKKFWENKYNTLLKTKREMDGSKQLQKKIDWLDGLEMPFKWKYEKLSIIETGFWDRAKIKKEIEHGKDYKENSTLPTL